ncbi:MULTISPECIES: hypothetical protein [unclassified Cryobacterium]|uniref:hypothetical protein n=1 Tax=unclassified Cryobacterium TaxID=2649013 RepID=UPI00106CA75E|nr:MULTISPECIES: hypothetical protein [unclassified Cryobacterium]TFB97055.1 hypothetical protein E3O39_08755 [Cryobacterium sp. MDB2-A-1]TFC08908.1 hypothetical protein E3O35_16190 [Cryobacterium sp. MDB2-A-2]TFC19266.1 hypothetical protein E3O51_06665 [Cryobacterium sp. MDB2-10]
MTAVLERMLPAWLVRHPLRSGWAWLALWGVVVASDALSPWVPGPGWYAVVLLAALPALAATVWLLAATPRDHLPPANDSVLGHFFVRFLALCAAFLVWGVSVVASSSISTAIQAAADDNDAEVTGLGFTLMLAAIPVVLLVLWMAFVVRCSWFLRRLRGWRELPEAHAVPEDFLRTSPRLRFTIVGLAHPGLLLAGGLGASVLAVLLGGPEFTLHLTP